MQPGSVALITAAALLVGALAWFALVFWHRRRPIPARSLFLMMLALGAVSRLAYVFLTPIFYAPDEQSHFNYVKYVAENGSLPVQNKGMGDPANEWEYHQPPIYYVLLVPIYLALEAASHSVAATVCALRLCSVVLWALNIWFGIILLKRLRVTEDLLWLGALAFGCLLPTYVFVSSAINNDNLLITACTGILCVLAGKSPTLKTPVILGALLGLSLWVKASAIVLLPAVGFFFLLEALQRRMPWRRAIGFAIVTHALAALIYAPWAARNWHVYGTLTPEGLTVPLKTWPSAVDGLLSASHNLVKTFWSVSGISNDIGYPFPLLGMCYGLMAVAGVMLSRKQQPQAGTSLWSLPESSILVAIGVAMLINVILVLRLGYLYGMGQGRHLFPLLYPIALLLACGLRAIPASNAPIHLVGFWITYALAFEAFSLSRFPPD